VVDEVFLDLNLACVGLAPLNFAPVLETKVGTYAAVHVQCSQACQCTKQQQPAVRGRRNAAIRTDG